MMCGTQVNCLSSKSICNSVFVLSFRFYGSCGGRGFLLLSMRLSWFLVKRINILKDFSI